MDWRVIAAVVGGTACAICIAIGYVSVLTEVHVGRSQESSPILNAGDPASTPELSTTQPLLESSGDDTQTQGTTDQQLIPKSPAPLPVHLVDPRPGGLLTDEDISQLRLSLRLSPDQEQKWQVLAEALQEAVAIEKVRLGAGQRWTDELNEQVTAKIARSARPLVLALRPDQSAGAGRLSRTLGFKSLSSLVEMAKAPTVPAPPKPVEAPPPLAVAPTLPPPTKLPVPVDHRYDGLLTAAEIGRIKSSLRLTREQEAYWPPVAAILSELGQQQKAQVDAGQKLDYAMSGGMAQRFYFAASPLLQTLTEEQKSEVRRRARIMGLEAYASYL